MGDRRTGKVALITGSTSGIGRACAERFAREGAKVVVNGYPAEAGPQVVEQIRANGGDAAYCEADIRQADDLKRLIAFASEQYGRLDLLMNNAYCGRSASVLEQEPEDWDEAFSCIVRAAYLGSKYALPGMIAAGGGAILNTASVHGLLAANGSAAYDSAKAALINLTRQMAVDYGKHRIRLNALCPGKIITERAAKWYNSHPEEIRRDQILYPVGRAGKPIEVANAALFLMSDEASFVTGHALVVDGGLTAPLQDTVASRIASALSGLDHPPASVTSVRQEAMRWWKLA